MANYTQIKKFDKLRKQILSHERNAISVKTESVVSVALVFPNSYSVGIANLGFQAVYKIFNQNPNIRCERAFFDRKFPVRTRTLETGSELRYFDIVAFSVSFELDIPNIIEILLESGITPLAEHRDRKEPLVIIGGAVSFLNPEPLSIFADIFVIGELEPVSETLIQEIITHKIGNTDKEELLEKLAQADGFYVPHLKPKQKQVSKVHSNLKKIAPHHSIVVTPKSHFQDMFLIEVGRGCGRRCRFCAASHIYHPYRVFSKENLLNAIEENIGTAKRVGLVGAALSDYPDLFSLCEKLVQKKLELGLSSFRLDMVDADFLRLLEKANVNSLAFAPEAGSERLRKLINKDLSEKVILQAAEHLKSSGINIIKFYYLIGLPEEDEQDIEEIVRLTKELQGILLAKNKNRKIALSINAFIPKPWTPFQWANFSLPGEIKNKRKHITERLKELKNIEIMKKSSREEVLQAVFSLGAKNVGYAAFLKVKEKISWKAAWQKAGVDLNRLIYERKTAEYIFPWDFIKFNLSKDHLFKIWHSIF